MRAAAHRLLIVCASALVLLLLAVGSAVAAHGGDIPRFGEGEECILVDFVYDDGHTDHYYACGDLAENDITREMVPSQHVGELHVSCSDTFPDGVFEKGDPTGSDGHEHTVADYRIVHYKDLAAEEIDKECEETFGPATPTDTPIEVCVDLVNDASGDGTYTDDELAPAPDADAPERMTITNCGDDPHVIESIVIDGEAVCDDLLGMTLEPGEDVTCDLVQEAHTPPADETETDTVTVVVHQPDNATNTATAEDPTAMTTALPTVEVCVDLVNDADGDGVYSDDELADAIGADVPERVMVTNCGDEPAVIDDVVIDGEDVCPDLLGMVLAPGESVTCDLVVPDHTPEPGEEETDAVTVVVHHPDHASVTATASDPTALATPDDLQVAAAGAERGDDPAVGGAQLPNAGLSSDELGLTGASTLALGMLLLLGAVPIVRQVGYAREDVRRLLRGRD